MFEVIQSKEQVENESCASGLHLSAPRQEEKAEPKHVNVNIFLSVTRKAFTVGIIFHMSFQGMGENFSSF